MLDQVPVTMESFWWSTIVAIWLTQVPATVAVKGDGAAGEDWHPMASAAQRATVAADMDGWRNSTTTVFDERRGWRKLVAAARLEHPPTGTNSRWNLLF